MPVQFNTGEWFTLSQGNTFRKIELNSEFPPDIDFGELQLCPAQYGGPVAIFKSPQQIIRGPGTRIHIYTATGKLISSFDWNSGNLLKMGWSHTEELICVQDDGIVLRYNMFGEYQHKFSLGQEVKDTKVIDARVFANSFGTGVAVMTTKFRISLVNSVSVPKNQLLAEMPASNQVPTCWEIVAEERSTFAIVVRGREIYKLSQGEQMCVPQVITMVADYQSISHIAVSFNQSHVALYTNNGHIWMGTSDLRTKYREFNTGQTKRPTQICWCLDGNEASALVISYPSQLLIIGVDGGSTQYPFDPVIHLVAELDCVRVITNTCHELIQKVPKCVNNIFAINSQEPSSFLFEAHKKFQERSHQSDEYLCLIKERLGEAVKECIEAAGFEFDPVTQKSLIQAAHFGKAFIPGHNPDTYIKMCRILRVLNAVRQPNVGLPLTFHQFIHLSTNVVLDRLVFRKHYGLAIQIAKHMRLTESRILEHWATHQVNHVKDDALVARKISDKFKTSQSPNISFCNIAKKAQERGRVNLAIMLLENETKASNKVPLLMKMGENQKALHSATLYGDTDLVYIVLMQLRETSALGNVSMIIKSFPMANNLYKKYLAQVSLPTLKEVINEEDDWMAQAQFAIREGFNDPPLFEINLSTASSFLKKDRPVEAALCDETRKLAKMQKDFTQKYSFPFKNLSVTRTITKLLQLGDLRVAEKVKSDFGVPDRKWWWLQIQVMAEQSQWEALEKFAKGKKSPIGYEPFVEVCVKHGKEKEAIKYIQRCRDDQKIKWCTRAGLHEEAARMAFEMKHLDGLYLIQEIVAKKNNTALLATINNYILQLSGKAGR